jgi:hypothetical protein
MGRLRVALVGFAAVVLVAACSPSSSSTATSSSAPPRDPATATVLFSRDSPIGSVPMAGPPDGLGATPLLDDGMYGNPTLAASTDGRVLAWTAYRVTAQVTSVPTYWVSVDGTGLAVPLPVDSRVSAVRVAADGHAVYYAVDRSLRRYDTSTHALTTLCAACLGAVPLPVFGMGLAITSGTDADGVVVWTFADDDTLITTVGVGQFAATSSIDKVGGLRSSSPTVTPTGLVGYGPISFVDGVWWYARDTPGTTVTTTLYVNADLTPEAERKLVDRVDGETSYGYTPVSARPGPITVVTPSPSS